MTRSIHQQAGSAIEAQRAALAEAITARHFALKPEFAERYGAAGRLKCLEDNAYHLSYLAEALNAAEPSLFADYVGWATALLAGRGIPAAHLADNLVILRDVLAAQMPGELSRAAAEYVEAGREQIDGTPEPPPSLLKTDEPLVELADAYLEALLRGRRDQAAEIIMTAVESRLADVKEIYLCVFQKTQHEIGRLWQVNRISVAQEHYCTAATQMIMSQLYPYIFASTRRGRTLVATCVSGDLHEIGVRMVSDFFEMDGWDTFYLGANTPAPALVETVADRRADLLLISATMTFHLRQVRELIEKTRADERTRGVKVMVGGYPFNVAPALWREIGADAFAADAESAVTAANRLMKEQTAAG